MWMVSSSHQSGPSFLVESLSVVAGLSVFAIPQVPFPSDNKEIATSRVLTSYTFKYDLLLGICYKTIIGSEFEPLKKKGFVLSVSN
jgi:hypothetical protein